MRIAVLGAALLLAGCASVTRGLDEQVQILSNPIEANVRVSNGFACITPCTLKFNRKDEFSVVFSKPGFHSAQIDVRTRLAGGGAAGFAGNVLLGGVIGMGVDAATGATLEHYPNPVTVTLMPLKKGEQPTVMNMTPIQEVPNSPAAAGTDQYSSAPTSDMGNR